MLMGIGSPGTIQEVRPGLRPRLAGGGGGGLRLRQAVGAAGSTVSGVG
jgi:hypothetical protein